MQSEQQQRIMGYFIEEAKDHLNTIEQGLLSLQSTMEDSEMMNEVFRAAHSVKGGAGMLGINSIHRTAHRLEDCLKVLQESPVKVDSQLETLFLQVFDTLEALVEQLQGPFGLADETANGIMLDAEPVFEQLNTHLEQLVRKAASSAAQTASAPKSVNPYEREENVPLSAQIKPSGKNVTVLPATFKRDVLVQLREMLQVFKQQDLPENREVLQEHCYSLECLGEEADLPGWSELLETSRIAIACPDNSYRLLASLVIKEIKQAQELAVAGRSVEIAPSEQLKALVPEPLASELEWAEFDVYEPESVLTDDIDFQTEEPKTAPANGNATSDRVNSATNLLNGADTYIQGNIREDLTHQDFAQDSVSPESDFFQAPFQFQNEATNEELNSANVTAKSIDLSDPEVGIAELNSLADIFEGQTPDLEQTWQQEEIIKLDDEQSASNSKQVVNGDDSSDFSDLIGDLDDFDLSTPGVSTSEELMGWFGDETTDEVDLHPQESEDLLFSEDEDLPSLADLHVETSPRTTDSAASSRLETSDFSDLLFEEETTNHRVAGAAAANELNNLFEDSFFEENGSLSDDLVDFRLDADAMPELALGDDDLLTMPESDALDDADIYGLGEMAWEEQAGLAETDSDFDDLLEISESDRQISGQASSMRSSTSEDALLFGEELEIDDEDTALGFDEFTFEEPVDNFELAASGDFDWGESEFDRASSDFEDAAVLPSREASESMDLLGDNFLDASTTDNESFTDFDQEDVLATDDLDGFESTDSLNLQESALDWESETEDALDVPALNLDVDESLWNLDESEFASAETGSAGIEALTGDFDFDTTSTQDDLFENETPSSLELPQSSNLNSLEGLGNWSNSSAAQTDELTFEEFDLDSLQESEAIQDFDTLNDFFDAEESETSDINNPTDFDDFSLLDTSTATDNADSTAEDKETAETDGLEALLGDENPQEAEALDLSSDTLNFEEDLFATGASVEGWDMEYQPQAALFDEDTEGSQATNHDLESLLGDENPQEAEALNLSSDTLNFEEDLFATGASVEGWDMEYQPQAALFDEDTEASQATNHDLEALLGDENPQEAEALDLSSDTLNFEEDLFATGASVEGWDMEYQPQAALFDEDTEASQATNHDLEALLGDENPQEAEALDLSSDTLNFEEDLFATGASVEGWDMEYQPQATLFDEDTEASQATNHDLEALLGDENPQEAEALGLSSDTLNFEEDLFATGASVEGWDMEYQPEAALFGEDTEASQAVDDLLDWNAVGTVEEENLDNWLGLEANEATEAQDGTLELEEDEAAALGIDWETADNDVGLEELTAASLGASALSLNSQTSEFDDLDALLASSGQAQAAETPVAMSELDGLNEFDDLEALLTQEAPSSGASTSADMEGFEDLEALLSEQMPAATEQSLAPAKSAALDADDFGDLEKLLEQADQTMGGPPTVAPDRQVRPPMRSRPSRGGVFQETMRVPVRHLDSLSNLVGELVVNRNSLEQDQERLRQFLDNLSHQVLALSDVGSRMQDLYERSLLETALLASRQGHRTPFHTSPVSQNSQTSGVEYDPLEMDRFTGFHSLSQEMIELIVRVRESASDIEFLVDETDQVARMLRQVTTQLQEGLTRSRMVPFAQTADRLPRAVRDISQKLGKEAQLYVEGKETLIDKMILEHLNDPMTHLINNALTHGIESPEVRRKAGKPTTGRITLRAFHQGNQTVIAVADDGAGINPEQVRAKAIERKLITPAEAKTLTNLDLYNFLFHPGFTTKDKEDEYAGRGVGMDVVLTSLSDMRGTIHIDSTLGKGTTFTIRLPLTLSICKALCCLSERARMAFPMDGVEDMLDLPHDRVQTNSEGQTCIQWRDTLLPFQPLSDLLKYNRQLSRGTVYGGKREDDMISIVVLRSAGNFMAIQVDQVLGEQEIVIKQLEGPAPKPVGIAGATVLGDGRIMPIADVLELIDLAMGRIRKDNVTTLWSREDAEGQVPEETLTTKMEPMVLIVDDSITVRELLSMTFAKSGYRVEQARDGQEAWDKLRSGLPCDIVFCDIEMPRMDGLELLSRLQKDETLCKLPIAMLTSRGADRHRQMAAQLGANGYFTKPYLEEVLLEAASRMIKGEVLFGTNSNA